MWSARDAVPTTVQFGVELTQSAQLAQAPAEKASAEVLETGRRIGQDLYQYISSFATTVRTLDGAPRPAVHIRVPGAPLSALHAAGDAIQLPTNVLERWLARFNSKCRGEGLDWLNSTG